MADAAGLVAAGLVAAGLVAAGLVAALAAGLAAGLAAAPAAGLVAAPAAGLAVRVSVFAGVKGLKGLGTPETLFLGAGWASSLFSGAGVNALGAAAGVNGDALLSRLAPPAGLKGLKAPVLGASAGWLAEPIFMKRIGLSECWGSTPSLS